MAGSIRNLCINKIVGFKFIKPTPSSNASIHCRTYNSALFVSGNKASKMFVYVTPDLDCSNRFKDIKKLQDELNQRGTKLNAEELSKTWDYYQYLLSNKSVLEEKLSQVNKQLAEVYKIENPTSDIISKKESLSNQNQLVKKDLRVMKEAVWELEDSLMPQILKLPNELDHRTPSDSVVVLKTVGEKPSVSKDKKQSHLDIGKRLDLIDYHNPIQYYLSNKAALVELEALDLIGRILNTNGFIRTSVPDFCRSLMIEGTGLDHENLSSTFILQENDEAEDPSRVNHLHLVGGASLAPLLAPYVKHSCKPESLPMRIFSTGRQYTPSVNSGSGLFSVCQASAAQVLILTKRKDSDEHEAELQRLISVTSEFYDALGKHYRVVFQPAPQLGLSESLRLSFEMWSVHEDRYVEVGYISVCGDYLAKRLVIAQQPAVDFLYPAAITGTLVSVPRLLGCLIEENPDEFILPESLTKLFG